MIANGLYALASLDGRTLTADDLGVLGLGERDRQGPGCVLAARDVRASAVHLRAHDDGIDALIGDLDEPADLARALGLPSTSDPLTLATAALDTFGDRAPRRMLGQWLFARWHAPSATLTLLMAEQVRDPCYVALGRGLVAVAPELPRLARLDWVDAEPDPRNLLLMMGRAPLRRAIGDGTILRGVHRVRPGTRVTVTADGWAASEAEPAFAPDVARAITFDEAIEEIDAILRRILRQHFARHGDSALLLSGGLDSSLLALISALERGSHDLTFLTSAAPTGSGLADETAIAAIVAAQLALPIHAIAPPAAANVYRPSHATFASALGPMLSPRHYLDEAMQDAARDLGVATLMNGMGGEMTVTSHAFFLRPTGWRQRIYTLARELRGGWREKDDGMQSAFNVRLSNRALADLPPDLTDLSVRNAPPAPRLSPGQPIGVEYGVTKSGVVPSTTTDPRLRAATPLLDRRLVHAVATMPTSFVRYRGQDRALARYLMQGRLPDDVVGRVAKLPYSPNYKALMRQNAGAAIARVADFRAEGLDAWIDLDWLARALDAMKNAPTDDQGVLHDVQMTAIAAEYLLWWRHETR